VTSPPEKNKKNFIVKKRVGVGSGSKRLLKRVLRK
jgi:hypothetical protein